MTEEYSTSDITTETTDESKPIVASQLLTVFNKTIHYEDDSSEDKSDTILGNTEGSKSTEDDEESEATEIQQVHIDLNKTTHDENDTSEIERYTEYGEQNNTTEDNSLLPIFKLKWKTKKLC